jgi:hypothetical protein
MMCHVLRLHQGDSSCDKTDIADVDAVLGDYTMDCITDASEKFAASVFKIR